MSLCSVGRPKFRFFSFALLLACLISARAWAGSTTVVISQVYGGGGNSSAAYDSDFIELFNLSGSPVSMNGWSVQYVAAGSTSTSAQVTAIGNVTLQPGQFYLIKEVTGTCTTTTTPSCPTFTGDNATQGTINLSGTAGKVFLVSSTTAITEASAASGPVTTCPATAPAGAAIIDYVGFGSTASCAEGAKNMAALSGNAQSAIRTNPCTDTDNNGNDFSVSTTVTPRSTTTPLSSCGTVNPTAPSLTAAISPSSQTSGLAVLLTAAVTPGTTPASTGITVTVDLSALGGSAAQPLNDSASNGDLTANDGTYSYSFTIPASQGERPLRADLHGQRQPDAQRHRQSQPYGKQACELHGDPYHPGEHGDRNYHAYRLVVRRFGRADLWHRNRRTKQRLLHPGPR